MCALLYLNCVHHCVLMHIGHTQTSAMALKHLIPFKWTPCPWHVLCKCLWIFYAALLQVHLFMMWHGRQSCWFMFFLFFKKVNVHTTKQMNKLLKYRLYGSCPHACLLLTWLWVSTGAQMGRRGHWIPWPWSCIGGHVLWYWEPNSNPAQVQQPFLTAEPSIQYLQ